MIARVIQEERDSYGNLSYQRWSDGDECWIERMPNGIIHTKWSHGSEYWDCSGGQTICKKYSNGSEEWYDSNGHKIEKGLFNFITHSYERRVAEAKKLISQQVKI